MTTQHARRPVHPAVAALTPRFGLAGSISLAVNAMHRRKVR